MPQYYASDIIRQYGFGKQAFDEMERLRREGNTVFLDAETVLQRAPDLESATALLQDHQNRGYKIKINQDTINRYFPQSVDKVSNNLTQKGWQIYSERPKDHPLEKPKPPQVDTFKDVFQTAQRIGGAAIAPITGGVSAIEAVAPGILGKVAERGAGLIEQGKQLLDVPAVQTAVDLATKAGSYVTAPLTGGLTAPGFIAPKETNIQNVRRLADLAGSVLQSFANVQKPEAYRALAQAPGKTLDAANVIANKITKGQRVYKEDAVNLIMSSTGPVVDLAADLTNMYFAPVSGGMELMDNLIDQTAAGIRQKKPAAGAGEEGLSPQRPINMVLGGLTQTIEGMAAKSGLPQDYIQKVSGILGWLLLHEGMGRVKARNERIRNAKTIAELTEEDKAYVQSQLPKWGIDPRKVNPLELKKQINNILFVRDKLADNTKKEFDQTTQDVVDLWTQKIQEDKRMRESAFAPGGAAEGFQAFDEAGLIPSLNEALKSAPDAELIRRKAEAIRRGDKESLAVINREQLQRGPESFQREMLPGGFILPKPGTAPTAAASTSEPRIIMPPQYPQMAERGVPTEAPAPMSPLQVSGISRQVARQAVENIERTMRQRNPNAPTPRNILPRPEPVVWTPERVRALAMQLNWTPEQLRKMLVEEGKLPPQEMPAPAYETGGEAAYPNRQMPTSAVFPDKPIEDWSNEQVNLLRQEVLNAQGIRENAGQVQVGGDVRQGGADLQRKAQVPPSVAPEAQVKQPWEMTEDEYVEPRLESQKEVGISKGAPQKYRVQHEDSIRKKLQNEHTESVMSALEAGQQVPVFNKPLWARTKNEQLNYEVSRARSAGNPEADSPGMRDVILEEHADAVKSAIEDGVKVPPEVLAEYPDLAQTHTMPTGETMPGPEHPGAVPGTTRPVSDAMRAKADALAGQASEHLTKMGDANANPMFDPNAYQFVIKRTAADVLYGAAYVSDFATWGKEMVKKYGPEIEQQLPQIWDEAQRLAGLAAQRVDKSTGLMSVPRSAETLPAPKLPAQQSSFDKVLNQPFEQTATDVGKGIAQAPKALYEQDIKPGIGSKVGATVEALRDLYYMARPTAGVEAPKLDMMMRMKGTRAEAEFKLDATLHSVEKYFDKAGKEAGIDFMDRVKRGERQATPELQQLADTFRALDDALWMDVAKFKDALPYMENHFRLLWDILPGTEGEKAKMNIFQRSRRPLRGSQGFMKKHSLADISEGIERGGVPRTYNPVTMYKMHYADVMKYITAQRMFEEMKRTGAAVKASEPPPGYVAVDDSLFNLNPKSGEHYYAEEGLGRLLNNFVSKDLIRGSNIGRGLVGIKNWTTMVELSLNGFHFTFETLEAMGSQIGQGLRYVANIPGIENKVKGIKELAASPAAPVSAARLGGKMFRALTKENFWQTPEGKNLARRFPNAKVIVEELFNSGASVKLHEDFRTNYRAGLRKALQEGNYIGAVPRAIFAANEAMLTPLFNTYIPRLKMGVFMKEASLALAERAKDIETGKLTRQEVLRKTWDFVEDRFGEMNFDNLWWNRTFKTANQIFFRSVTWKLGNLRGMLGSVPEQAGELMRSAKEGKRPILTQKMAWLAGMSLLTAATGSIIMKAFTGMDPQSLKDFVFPRVDPNDPSVRINTPTYWKDALHLFKSPKKYVRSSMSTEIMRFWETLNNNDYFGNMVYDPKDPLLPKAIDIAQHMFPIPISVSSFRQLQERGQNPVSMAMAMIGFNEAPGSIEQSQGLQDARMYIREHQPAIGRTPEQAQRAKLSWKVQQSMLKSEPLSPEDLADLRQLPEQMQKNMMKASKKNPAITAFLRLPATVAVESFPDLDSEEKKLVAPIVLSKIRRSESVTNQEKQELVRKMMGYIRQAR